jgi:hypothetical protein
MYQILKRAKNYKPGLLTRQLAELDASLTNDFLESDSVYSLVLQVCKKYGVDDYARDVILVLSLLVTKIISNQDFINELADFVPEEYFNRFRQELEEKLFAPFEVYLYKAGIAYKQLTKLEPQPIEITEPEPESPMPASVPTPVSVPAPTAALPKQKPQPAIPVAQTPTATAQTPPVPAPTPAPQKPPEPIVITRQTAPSPTPGPSVPLPKPSFVSSTVPRIKMGDTKISQQAPVTNLPKPPQPIFMGVKFESLPPKPEIKQEFVGTTEKKQIQVPAAPEVPKAVVQGKEVIDLTSFSVKNPEDKPNESK